MNKQKPPREQGLSVWADFSAYFSDENQLSTSFFA